MSKERATKWMEIYITLEKKGFISMGTLIALSENVARNYKISKNTMNEIINTALKFYDDEVSFADIHVAWEKEEPEDKASKWAGIISVMEKNRYLSLAGVVEVAENVARNYKLKWKEMAELLNYANRNINFEESWIDVEYYPI